MFGPAFLAASGHPRDDIARERRRPTRFPLKRSDTPDGKPGIAVEYFEGTNFEKPASQTVDTKVDYTWPGPPLDRAGPPA